MFCTACGAQHPIGDLFCKRCGSATHPVQRVPEDDSAAEAHLRVAPPLQGYVYADLWKRFAALQIDMILFVGALALVFLAFGQSVNLDSGDELPGDPEPYLAWFGLLALYYLWMDASRWQGTFGKQAVGLRVTDQKGARLSYRASLLRLASRPLAVISGGVGFLILQAYPKRQTWYDRIAGSVVLYREEQAPTPPSPAPPPSLPEP